MRAATTSLGVVQDFNFQSLREKIEPTIMSYGTDGNRLAIKLKGHQMADFLTDLDQTWQQFNSEQAISYTFLDDNFAKLAEQEKMLGQAVAFFTSLAHSHRLSWPCSDWRRSWPSSAPKRSASEKCWGQPLLALLP